jgi:hypothetical protein
LLWADRLAGTFTHTQAITLAQDGTSFRVVREDACASPAGHDASVHLPEPFGLPTYADYAEAERDGIREVLPHFNGDEFWSGALVPNGKAELTYDVANARAFKFHARDFGNLGEWERTAAYPVRCVSRTHAKPPTSSTAQPGAALAGRVECGIHEQTVEARLRACAALPRSEKVGAGAAATAWNLVTRRFAPETGKYYEVWRDAKTGLLWGDRLEDDYDHYHAVRMNDDGTVRTELACATADAERANGHIGEIRFRLPTLPEYRQAREDQMKDPLRDSSDSTWTESVGTGSFTMAYVGSDGGMGYRLDERPVRCVSGAPVTLGAPLAPSPAPDCGTGAGATDDRIRACAAQPESLWESDTHVSWKLVARHRDGTTGKRYEAWQDGATGLLWGDALDKAYPFHDADKACMTPEGQRANAGIGGSRFRMPTGPEFERAVKDGALDALPHLRSLVYWAASTDACSDESWVKRHAPHLIGSNADAGRGSAMLFRGSGNGGSGMAFCDQAVAVRCVSP